MSIWLNFLGCKKTKQEHSLQYLTEWVNATPMEKEHSLQYLTDWVNATPMEKEH